MVLEGNSARVRLRHRRRGVTAVLAMLYLVLFSTLAIGFYGAVTMSVQVSKNELDVSRAQLAAESGMSFMRYQMSRLSIAGSTSDDDLIDEAYASLQSQLNGSANMGAMTVGLSGETISVPAGAGNYLAVDGSGSKFSATVTQSSTSPDELVVTLTGTYGSSTVTRGIRMSCEPRSEISEAFNYAVASKGRIYMKKGSVTGVTDPTVADMLSASTGATAINMTGGTVGGDLAVTTSNAACSVTGGSVGGTSNLTTIYSDHVHVVSSPPFPTFDTTTLATYATNTYPASGSPYTNLRIPANTNPKFTGNVVINGILYVESPNDIEFRGNCTVNGFIVFENGGTDASNSLDFRGNVSHLALPSGSQYDALRHVSGFAVLAPTAKVTMSGSTDSSLAGSLICSKFDFAGSADIVIDRGTLMALSTATDAVQFQGKTVKFTNPGAANAPTEGVNGTRSYKLMPSTYEEVVAP